ncbi:MAG: hypothetical protein K8I27_05070 [Planctomycetes bacterium]|nr:hypothetical protein [Planctomycetota bacterium]
MRIHHHDVRDMSLAFGLAFDLRRVMQAGLALSWTLVVLTGLSAILSWRTSAGMMTAEGIYVAVSSIGQSPWTPLKVLLFTCMGMSWWVGFAYLCAPIQRGAALDIARDERERNPSIPPLNRQAAFAPVIVALVPLIALLTLALWALLTYIPGTAGALVATVALPLVLLVVIPCAAFVVVGTLAAPMMGPTAVVEGRDYLEAISRPMSYVLQRPGRYFAYWGAKLGVMGASALAGGVTLAVAWVFVWLALWLTGQQELARESMLQAMADPDVRTASDTALGIAVVFWGSVFMLAAWLAVVGLSCDMIIYLLMRYQVDGVTFDKIAVAEERLQFAKTALDTAEEAEQARKRFDALQPEPASAGDSA